MSKRLSLLVYVGTVVFFGCFFVWPLQTMLSGAFFDADHHLTWSYIDEVWRNPIYVEGLRNSLLVGLGSTMGAMALALPLAYAAARWEFPGRSWLSGLLLTPLMLPPFVGAIGVRQILGQAGALNALLEHWGLLSGAETPDWLGRGRFWGVVALNALHLYPIVFLNVTTALANLDPALEEAAANLGCSGWRSLRRITLPLILPGLFAGASIVFIFAFTELGAPLIFDYSRVTPVQIFYGLKEIAGNPFPFALVSMMLASTLLLYAASRWAFGRPAEAMSSKGAGATAVRQVGRLAGWLAALGCGAVAFLALLPHLAVLGVSLAGDWYRSVLPASWTLGHYEAALGSSLTVPAIANSLKYASCATVIDLLLGSAIGWVIVRSRLPGRALLDGLAMLPLAVPGLVLAFGYLAMTQDASLAAAARGFVAPLAWLQPGLARGAADRLFSFLSAHFSGGKDPTMLLIVAYSVRRLPYVVRAAVSGLQQTSTALEEAAQNLGATAWRAMRRITLPLIAANLLGGGLLAFAFATLEVSDSLILAQQQRFFPITRAIYELFQLLGEGRFAASALGVWAMAFLGCAIFAASRLLGRRVGAVFRL